MTWSSIGSSDFMTTLNYAKLMELGAVLAQRWELHHQPVVLERTALI